MKFFFTPMNETSARQIASWQYPVPYSIYNIDPHDFAYLLEPQNHFYAITDEQGELVGFCSFGGDGQVPGGNYDDSLLDIGAGMRPDLTGQGNGLLFLKAILDFARKEFTPAGFRVTVATFNHRAIQMCRNAGFQSTETFNLGNIKGEREFMILELRP